MQTLPPVIRNYLAQGKYTAVAQSLMTTYRLRIDQGGILEREIMLLLMGIENPDEFTQALAEEAKLDQQTINDITRDVNEQIFVPLREQMRSGGVREVQPEKPVVPARTVIIPANPQMPPAAGLPKGSPRPQQTLTSVPRYAPPVAGSPAGTPQRYFHLQNKIPLPPPPVSKPMTPVGTAGRRLLLEDHEEPHIEFSKAPQAVPARTIPPPPNLPGVIQPSSPLPLPKPKPIIPAAPYSADPYREPIE